jgi:iron(III) transport system substrate-binding protein
MRLLPKALLALIATTVTATVAVAQDKQPSWADVEAAAKKVGKITIYENWPPPGDELLFNEFAKAHPDIKVETVRLSSSALIQRFETEYSAGKSPADIFIVVWDDVLTRWAKDGWIRQWTPPELKAYTPDYMKDYQVDNKIFTVALNRDVLVYNTTKIKPADAPKEWADLFDPKWKGKIGFDPPWRSTSIQGTVAFLEKKGGFPNLAQRLKDNGVQFFNGSAGTFQAVIRGDIWIGFGADPSAITMKADGAPIALVYPKTGVPSTPSVMFVPARAPNPEGGMMLLNWLLSQNGQIAEEKYMGTPGMRPGLPPRPELPGNASLNIVPKTSVLTSADQEAIVKEFRGVFELH